MNGGPVILRARGRASDPFLLWRPGRLNVAAGGHRRERAASGHAEERRVHQRQRRRLRELASTGVRMQTAGEKSCSCCQENALAH